MKLGLLQLNPTVGDFAGNAERVLAQARRAQELGAELAITSELAMTGYPPRDFLLRRRFVDDALARLGKLAQELKGCMPVLVGAPEWNAAELGRPLFNAAYLLHDGEVRQTFRKTLLPTYDVFDEDRYFEPFTGEESKQILELNGFRFGISICEDVWNDSDFWKRPRYHTDPVERLVKAGAQGIINLSASPFTVGKQQVRERMLGAMASRHGLPLVYVNQAGGNDDLIFDGRSCVFDRKGKLIARAKGFDEDVLIADIAAGCSVAEDDFAPESEIWRALVIGTRDYVRKCGFSEVLLGLSGGIDSALTAAIAAEAVGAKNVTGVLMPSPYSSEGSVADSLALAERLGIRAIQLPIQEIMKAFEGTLSEAFKGRAADLTEENIQSRIRGNLLMALSNKYRALLLTTGNKSELSVGYCTIYGDMSGGLAVIADVPKTMVYRVARWRNGLGVVIPENSITKAPSAELRPNQTDQDSLPPYEVLDEILRHHIELNETAEELIAKGFDEATVRRVCHLVRIAEFKRKQAAPGLKVTDRAFGTGWRMPIAARS